MTDAPPPLFCGCALPYVVWYGGGFGSHTLYHKRVAVMMVRYSLTACTQESYFLRGT